MAGSGHRDLQLEPGGAGVSAGDTQLQRMLKRLEEGLFTALYLLVRESPAMMLYSILLLLLEGFRTHAPDSFRSAGAASTFSSPPLTRCGWGVMLADRADGFCAQPASAVA